ncbi:leucine-rich repeat domain-containing protein [Salinimicrobium xinjiangense]|uniref:leucine-rich repeat domain-containing protein n=1 Tax=Salinimicrobium xinjiangense TaxID=438596 RepID=UPI00041637A6|nr:leucine-rich repeat domain-containing protein [Salinimicrobium xinjiangense]
MKRYFLPLLLFSALFLATACEPEGSGDKEPEPPVAEEIIEIPDEHFKHALVSTNSIDTNGDNEGDSDIDLNNDGEIQRSEAELIEGLILHFNYIEFERYVDLSGIENFLNLRHLKMSGDHRHNKVENEELITYDLSGLKKLEYVQLSNLGTNAFEAIDLRGLSNLKELILLNSRPDYGLDFEDWNKPIAFMDIKLEGASNLTVMDITNSFLNIDFCKVPSLKRLNMSYLEGGEPEIFDFHCLTNLEWLDISDNHIDKLILKNSSVLNTLIARDIGYGEDGFANYPYLEHICIDDIPEEFEQIATLRDENTVVVTDCSY